MILVILFVVLNAIYIAGLLWCILAIRSTTKIGARVMDIHTNALRRQSAEIATLRESQFPRYSGAVTPLPDAGEWAAHDAAVSDAIAAKVAENARYGKTPQNGAQSLSEDVVSAYPTYAQTGKLGLWQNQPMRESGGGVPMMDPETAPFFTQSQPEK